MCASRAAMWDSWAPRVVSPETCSNFVWAKVCHAAARHEEEQLEEEELSMIGLSYPTGVAQIEFGTISERQLGRLSEMFS